MPKPNEETLDDLPDDIRQQVDQIRHEESLDEAPVEEEEQQLLVPKITRRQQKAQEEEEERKRKEARDAEILESNKRSSEELAELRRINLENAERMARLEGTLQATILSQRQTVQQPTQDEESAERIYQRKEREALDALKSGKMDEYHSKLREAHEALWNDREKKIRGSIPQPHQQQQQVFQKPDWVSAVEAQYPDVMMFRDERRTGQSTVVAIHNLMYGFGAQATPESLSEAYKRARKELGIEKTNTEDPKANDRKRQMLAGARPSGGGGGSGNSKPNGKTGDQYVRGVPTNWKQIARANKMTDAQYLREFAEMNPENVESSK